jgi:hypothetical protein
VRRPALSIPQELSRIAPEEILERDSPGSNNERLRLPVVHPEGVQAERPRQPLCSVIEYFCSFASL